MKLQPLSDRVVILPTPTESKTTGGIIIPETAKAKPQKGTVIAAGSGRDNKPLTVKEGDEVIYTQGAGTEVKSEGTAYLIMREQEIFGIIKQ